jgi:putative nucleotidyltransferase with HDIG domain
MTGDRPLELVRSVLEGGEAWLVGGAVRDGLLGREPITDIDVAVPGDPREAARAVARATRGAAFPLSEAFGAWRVVGPGQAWQLDVVALRDGDLRTDLGARDFTINAMAAPLAGGDRVDPFGGEADLRAGRVRMVAERALAEDPLRTLRAVRFSTELGFEIDPGTSEAVRRHGAGLARVAGERVFAELRRVIASPDVIRGIESLHAHGITGVVLPELETLRGVEQSDFHHLDVHDHSLEVLQALLQLERDPGAVGLGRHADQIAALLREPLADGLTRGQAMRFAALLHDVAKPQTREVRDDGRVTFMGHDRAGAEQVAGIMRRLRVSERLVDYVSALTRHHLRLGFLVHEGALTRRTAWRYMRLTEPVAPDVTLLTVADRVATRGRNADRAIALHLALADGMLEHVFAERDRGRPAPLLRGDELMRELGIAPGPQVGELLARLEEDRYAGDLATREDALRRAREIAAEP